MQESGPPNGIGDVSVPTGILYAAQCGTSGLYGPGEGEDSKVFIIARGREERAAEGRWGRVL